MKGFKIYGFLLAILLFTSCSTYQYTSRQVKVNREDIVNRQQGVDIDVDYTRTVTATSDYHITKQEALKEAEFKCLKENKIDVIVDPIVEYKKNNFRIKRRFKATIIGFVGTYKEAPISVDATKGYSREEIENYKLLTDPNFPQYYYNKEGGNSYFFYGKPQVNSTTKKMELFPDLTQKNYQHKLFDYDKAKKLRNAGIGTTIAGVTSMFIIGLPCLFYEGISGITFMTLGGAAIVTGVPMLAIGSYRMKHSKDAVDLALTTTGTGIGLSVNF